MNGHAAPKAGMPVRLLEALMAVPRAGPKDESRNPDRPRRPAQYVYSLQRLTDLSPTTFAILPVIRGNCAAWRQEVKAMGLNEATTFTEEELVAELHDRG